MEEVRKSVAGQRVSALVSRNLSRGFLRKIAEMRSLDVRARAVRVATNAPGVAVHRLRMHYEGKSTRRERL
jgi:hypothetical protein